jgi:hypothetical protein
MKEQVLHSETEFLAWKDRFLNSYDEASPPEDGRHPPSYFRRP